MTQSGLSFGRRKMHRNATGSTLICPTGNPAGAAAKATASKMFRSVRPAVRIIATVAREITVARLTATLLVSVEKAKWSANLIPPLLPQAKPLEWRSHRLQTGRAGEQALSLAASVPLAIAGAFSS